MKILKAAANTFLSLLLFICLVALGAAIMINATALSPGFVNNQTDRLDVVAIFNEKAVPELQQSDVLAAYPDVVTGIQSAVTTDAPAIKSATEAAVSDIYAYLLHGGTLDLRATLQKTILDPQLAVTVLDQLDLSSYIRQVLIDNLPLGPALFVGDTRIDLTPYLDTVVAVVQPYFKQQLALLIPQYYDYLLGETETLDLNVPVTPIVGDIGSTLKSAVLASPPVALASLSPLELSLAFDVAWAFTVPQIPASIDLTSETGLQPPAPITPQLNDAQNDLANARTVVADYQEAFLWLIGLTVLLIVGIVLVNRNVKASCRALGGTFATYGIFGAAGLLISRALFDRWLPTISGLPQSLESWLIQLADAAMKPLLIFAAACAALGIILLVVSLLYHGVGSRAATA